MPKMLLDLGVSDCRYILPSGDYCAETITTDIVGSHSYCDTHVRLCYVFKEGARPRMPFRLPVDLIAVPEPVEQPPRELLEEMHK